MYQDSEIASQALYTLWDLDTNALATPSSEIMTSNQALNAGPGFQMDHAQVTMTGTNKTAFEAWCADQGISDATAKLLSDQGFTSKRTIKLLSPDSVKRLGQMPLGQELLLLDVIESLKQESASSTSQVATKTLIPNTSTPAAITTATVAAPTTSDTPSDQTPLLMDLIQGLAKQKPPQGKDFDPHFYLEKASTSRKCLNIIDFVPSMATPHESRMVSDNTSEGRLVLELGPKKPKLENVSPHQWGAANIRILYDLLKSQQLHEDNLYDYLSYTAKVHELAECFQWQSVLQYDKLYRELQSAQQFRWGSDSAHLFRVHLVPRSKPSSTTGSQSASTWSGRNAKSKAPTDPVSSKEVCMRYNKELCQKGNTCHYAHVCMFPNCFQPHPISKHPKN